MDTDRHPESDTISDTDKMDMDGQTDKDTNADSRTDTTTGNAMNAEKSRDGQSDGRMDGQADTDVDTISDTDRHPESDTISDTRQADMDRQTDKDTDTKTVSDRQTESGQTDTDKPIRTKSNVVPFEKKNKKPDTAPDTDTDIEQAKRFALDYYRKHKKHISIRKLADTCGIKKHQAEKIRKELEQELAEVGQSR
jgi:clumping factor A